MTKSTITREQLEEWVAQFDEDGGCDATDRQLEALIRQSLAAMDSEPVAYRWNYGGTTTWRLQDTKPTPGSNRIWPRVIEPLYRHAQPAPVVPEIDRKAIADKVYGKCSRIPGATFYNAAEFAIDEMEACHATMLAVAPQLPGSESATVPGKWIPVSERMPDCWCRTCRPVVLNDMRFVVCPDCGNKRCPRANDHRNACTGSNEPGQEGSAYPAAPQEMKGES